MGEDDCTCWLMSQDDYSLIEHPLRQLIRLKGCFCHAALKLKSIGLAAYLKDKASQASSSVADPTSRQQTFSRLKYWGAG